MNPYREHMDKLQTTVKQTTREFIYGAAGYDRRLADNVAYNTNFAVVSGGNPFDLELLSRVDALMKEATGVPDPEIV